MTDFSSFCIAKFRQGQHAVAAWHCQPGNRVAHVYDGDVTTYAYAIPDIFTDADFNEWATDTFGDDARIDHISPDEFDVTP